MTKPKMTYFEEEDILHLVILDEPESDSLELSLNITAELNENDELIGIKILSASAFIQDTVLDAKFAKRFCLPMPIYLTKVWTIFRSIGC